MPDERRWSDDAQRYLDGAGALPQDPAERAEAMRFAAALGAYADGLRVPDAGLEARVMGALRTRARPSVGGVWWRRLVQPRMVSLRPALAAAAAVALVAMTSFVTLQLARQGLAAPAVDVRPGTVLVRFELDAPDARRVALAGSFNEWSDSTIVFTRGGADGVWGVTVALPPGRYQYLFVVDGERWMPDPAAHAQVEDEFGQQNSLLVVGPRGVVRS